MALILILAYTFAILSINVFIPMTEVYLVMSQKTDSIHAFIIIDSFVMSQMS